MLLLVLGLVLFLLLVILHELGHFIAARRGGVEVEEFGIGFPPRLFGRRFLSHPTIYSLNLLPLGGFVRLRGEHDQSEGPGSFGAAPLKTKVKIMLAGVFMNLVIAWLFLAVLAAVGIPKLPLPGEEKTFTVASDSHLVSRDLYASFVEKDSPAAEAGIKADDKILNLNGQKRGSAEQLRSATKSLAGQSVSLVYEHDGEQKSAE